MIQMKSNVEGMEVRGPKGAYYMSPQRDITFNFPVFVHMALQFIKNKEDPGVKAYYANGGSDEELGRFAKVMAEYVDQAYKTNCSVHMLAKAAGWDDTPTRVKQLFGYCLAHVTMSAYTQGVREATAGHYAPFQFGGPDDILKFQTETPQP